MGPEVVNKNAKSNFYGDYVGRDNITVNVTLFQDSEREFVVTHNANIKPVSYFTGRETELQELRQRIEEGRKSVLVSGMGGIGKTHICRKLFEEYLNKHAEGKDGTFKHIGYIEYNGDMGSSLQNCLKFKQQDSPEQNQEAAWRELEYLASDGKLLLFVDNVNVTIGEDVGLGRLKKIPGAVVLTTRRTSFSKEFEPYRIGFLNMEQCKEIYRFIRYEGSEVKVPEEQIPDLEYIIGTQAAGHTMTIEFLAHLARTKHWTAKDLRDKLKDKGFQLEYKDDEDKLVNIQKSYEALYVLSELADAEQNILEAFSVFPYIPLEAKTCKEWLLADAGVSEDDDVLVGLYRKGWLQFDIKKESYALHPVFAKFIYEKCKPELENHSELIKACRESVEIPENGSVVECQKYIPFAENIIEKMSMGNSIGLIYTIACSLCHVAEYKKAEVMYKKCLEIKEKVVGEKHIVTAASYNNLAYVYEAQGDYQKAEELYEKSLQISEQVLGENHPDTATIYNNLGQVYLSRGKFKKAEELCEKALWIRKKVLGENHPDTAVSYHNLASVYGNQGEYEKAEELLKKSLAVCKKVFGENHPDIAAIYDNLAYVYESQGEYGKAEKLYEKSMRIFEKVFGENHPDTATAYNNLGLVYKRQGKYEKAEELYEKALIVGKRVFGENHLNTAMGYNNLGALYSSQGEYEKAMAYGLKASKIIVLEFGLMHPDTQLILGNLVHIYEECYPEGNFEQWLEEKMKESD